MTKNFSSGNLWRLWSFGLFLFTLDMPLLSIFGPPSIANTSLTTEICLLAASLLFLLYVQFFLFPKKFRQRSTKNSFAENIAFLCLCGMSGTQILYHLGTRAWVYMPFYVYFLAQYLLAIPYSYKTRYPR